MPEPTSSHATCTITIAIDTDPNADGDTSAATKISDPNQASWLTTWPPPTHEMPRTTVATESAGRGGSIAESAPTLTCPRGDRRARRRCG